MRITRSPGARRAGSETRARPHDAHLQELDLIPGVPVEETPQLVQTEHDCGSLTGSTKVPRPWVVLTSPCWQEDVDCPAGRSWGSTGSAGETAIPRGAVPRA